MKVVGRIFEGHKINGMPYLGAIRISDRVIAGFPAGTLPADLRDALGSTLLDLATTGQSVLATLATDAPIKGAPVEVAFFRGKNVLVAFRNAETPEAAADWLAMHAAEHQAEAALIFDRDPPGRR